MSKMDAHVNLIVALAGGVYGVVDSGMKQYRNKGDAWNKFSAGCAAGFIIGMQGEYCTLSFLCID